MVVSVSIGRDRRTRDARKTHLEVPTPNAHCRLAADGLGPLEVHSPDPIVQRSGESTQSAVKDATSVSVGEGGGAGRVGEQGEVREPETGHLRVKHESVTNA